MLDRIHFWSPREQPYGIFSNFARAPFIYNGARFFTVETFYQAAKFLRTAPHHAAAIVLSKSPKDAKFLGRTKEFPLDPEWESIKEDIMLFAIGLKFDQNPKALAVLLSTGTSTLVENSPYDYYWGIGRDGTGQNRLGHVLMIARSLFTSRRNCEN